jgi:uncharacterized protein with HEPN domain
MTKAVEPYLNTILDSLNTLLSRMPEDKAQFFDNGILQDATLMRLQEAGEQLVRIRDKFPDYYESHQTDAWHRLIGLRNIIAHGYLEISMEEVWKTVSDDVPKFVTELQELV